MLDAGIFPELAKHQRRQSRLIVLISSRDGHPHVRLAEHASPRALPVLGGLARLPRWRALLVTRGRRRRRARRGRADRAVLRLFPRPGTTIIVSLVSRLARLSSRSSRSSLISLVSRLLSLISLVSLVSLVSRLSSLVSHLARLARLSACLDGLSRPSFGRFSPGFCVLSMLRVAPSFLFLCFPRLLFSASVPRLASAIGFLQKERSERR